MSGSYLDAMSDPPSWTTLMGSGKGTGPPRICRVSAPVATEGHHSETARLRRTHPRVSIVRQRAASWAVPSLNSNNLRLCARIFGLGHCREPAQRRRAHLRVNVARRRAGQREAPHLRPAGRRPPSLSLDRLARTLR
jgi:hypothetical protein